MRGRRVVVAAKCRRAAFMRLWSTGAGVGGPGATLMIPRQERLGADTAGRGGCEALRFRSAGGGYHGRHVGLIDQGLALLGELGASPGAQAGGHPEAHAPMRGARSYSGRIRRLAIGITAAPMRLPELPCGASGLRPEQEVKGSGCWGYR